MLLLSLSVGLPSVRLASGGDGMNGAADGLWPHCLYFTEGKDGRESAWPLPPMFVPFLPPMFVPFLLASATPPAACSRAGDVMMLVASVRAVLRPLCAGEDTFC